MTKKLIVVREEKCIGCELCVLEVQRQDKLVGIEGSCIRILRQDNDRKVFKIDLDPMVNSKNIQRIVDVCPTKVFEVEENEA